MNIYSGNSKYPYKIHLRYGDYFKLDKVWAANMIGELIGNTLLKLISRSTYRDPNNPKLRLDFNVKNCHTGRTFKVHAYILETATKISKLKGRLLERENDKN